ncbi:hypothetical protein HDV00_005573 [Rhizophlyctis rosea]|nr:hypothetical protein HDV00_005573 [Rhizophlyctis rosea]
MINALCLTNALLLTIEDGTTLKWKLDKHYLVEAREERGGWIGALARGSFSNVTLFEALEVLRLARDDDRIRGLEVDLSTAGVTAGTARPLLGLAQVQELREAVKKFAEAKKKRFGEGGYKLVAYSDTFGEDLHPLFVYLLYYLGTAFNKIEMEPRGSLPLVGLQATQPFLKTLLDRIGISIRAFTHGEYKSVAAMFTETDYPKPILENITEMLKSLNDQLIAGIAVARKGGLSRLAVGTIEGWGGGVVEDKTEEDPSEGEKVQRLMDIAPLTSQESHDAGLVDEIAFKRAHNPQSQHKSSNDSSSPPPPDSLPLKSISLHRYRISRTQELKSELAASLAVGKPLTTIGLVYLCGSIMRGDGQFGSNQVAKSIANAAMDPEVGSVVVRIDSGGGDVVASETVWEAVRFAREVCGKSIVASIGNVGASGAYYIAAPCTQILASPGTITGSIGVAATRPYITPALLDKLGINVGQIYFSEGARNGTVLVDLEGRALERAKRQVAEMYEVFLETVLVGWEGRERFVGGREGVEGVAGGRVWSGVQGWERGLVDHIGGLHTALRIALHTATTHQNPKPILPLTHQPKPSDLVPHPHSHAPHAFPPDDLEIERDEFEGMVVKIFPRPTGWLERVLGEDGGEGVLGGVVGRVAEGVGVGVLVRGLIAGLREGTVGDEGGGWVRSVLGDVVRGVEGIMEEKVRMGGEVEMEGFRVW